MGMKNHTIMLAVSCKVKHACTIFITPLFIKMKWKHVPIKIRTQTVIGHTAWQAKTGNNPNGHQEDKRETDFNVSIQWDCTRQNIEWITDIHTIKEESQNH